MIPLVVKSTDPLAVEKSINILKKGGVIVYPTDTLYGFGVDANNNYAIERINKLKNRHSPMSVIACRFEQAMSWTNIKEKDIEIAKKIQQELKFDKDFIENISITNPGFINFKLSKSFYQSIINEVLLNNKFGSNRSNDGKTANVEFVSANPTGPLTIGHGRNGVIGDIISFISIRRKIDWLSNEF